MKFFKPENAIKYSDLMAFAYSCVPKGGELELFDGGFGEFEGIFS
ncbi:hypothetical protein [Niastella populi]|nr:hypothetical protein [Niastella populi]